MNEVLLKDIYLEDYKDNRICDFPFIEISHGVRLFYKVNDADGHGFNFYAVQITSGQSHEDWWNPETSCAECLYCGVAYFDGIRHLYMGTEQTDNFGYIYYPSLSDHAKIMSELETLVNKFCSQPN